MSLSIKNSCGGKSLPELTSPATASDIVSGKQAIDGSGAITEGSVYEVTDIAFFPLSDSFISYNSDTNRIEAGALNFSDFLLRSNAEVIIETPPAQFGNATAPYVAAGKTFTSAAGLKVPGTGVMLGGTYDLSNAEYFKAKQDASTTATLTISFNNYHEKILAKLHFMTTETNYYEAYLYVVGNECILVSAYRSSSASFAVTATKYLCVFNNNPFAVSRSGNNVTFSLTKGSIDVAYVTKNMVTDTVNINKMGNGNVNYEVFGV